MKLRNDTPVAFANWRLISVFVASFVVVVVELSAKSGLAEEDLTPAAPPPIDSEPISFMASK